MRCKWADFGISPPAPSADALPANRYGHSTWRPLWSANALPATLYGHFTQAIYRNRPLGWVQSCTDLRAVHVIQHRHGSVHLELGPYQILQMLLATSLGCPQETRVVKNACRGRGGRHLVVHTSGARPAPHPAAPRGSASARCAARTQDLEDIALLVIGCHVTQEARAQNALNDVARGFRV